MSPRRRGRGEGSIYRRPDGRWVATIDLGWHGGKRRRKFLYGKTRAEVARKLAAALQAHRDGQVFGDERTTVEQFLSAWLVTVEASLAPRTWTRYEQLIRRHTAPHIGKVRLTKLGARHLDQLYGALVRSGLSPTTVLQLHRILHHALRDAMRWNLVARNVAELVTPPRRARHDFVTLTPEQARRFLNAVKGDRLEALYILGLTTGMREGELFGLRWADVDLAAGALHLVRRLKTRSSRRQVLLVRVAVEALRRHLANQREERRQLGLPWDEQGLVFPNTVGRPLHSSNFLQRSFYPLLEQAGLPRIRFHDLRHSAATLLLGLGIHPKIVSEMLGHSQIGITLDLYSHVTATMQQEAVRAFDGLFGSQFGSQEGATEDHNTSSGPVAQSVRAADS
jgi:integrase